MSLKFRASELQRELEVFKHLARTLVDPTSVYVLDEFGVMLEQLLRTPGRAGRWEIRRDRPITTVCTDGDHEPDQRGKLDLYGQMSCVWEVTPLRSANAKRGPADLIDLTGVASIRMAVVSEEEELSSWTAEVASDGAPGVYFHSQMSESGLPIPRLPAYALTPVGGMEFLLCELFRSQWPAALAKNSSRANMWMGIQTHRFSRTMMWLTDVVAGAGSPIVALQSAVPKSDMYL